MSREAFWVSLEELVSPTDVWFRGGVNEAEARSRTARAGDGGSRAVCGSVSERETTVSCRDCHEVVGTAFVAMADAGRECSPVPRLRALFGFFFVGEIVDGELERPRRFFLAPPLFHRAVVKWAYLAALACLVLWTSSWCKDVVIRTFRR